MTGQNVLVVEDNTIVATDIRTRLEQLGYRVQGTARSGREAIEKAGAGRPDLVLMDIKLKGDMDGVEAAQEIRDRFYIPVVYLTAYADDDTLKRAKITEPFGYIVKPFDENALHTNIEIALFKHAMERKLRESERWFATTLKCVGDATIATDRNGYIKFMNPAAERLTGWKKEEIVGQYWRDVLQFVDGDTRRPTELPDETLSGTWAIGDSANQTFLVNKLGSETPIELTVAPIVDEGETIGVVLVFRDISERKVAEEALRQNHELLQAVIEGIGDVIFLRNPEGRFLMTNAAGSRLLGSPEVEIIGKSTQELFAPATASLLDEAHRRALSTERSQTFELNVTCDGVERIYLVSEEVCWSKDGKVEGTISVARDFTEIKVQQGFLEQGVDLDRTGRAVGELASEMNQSLRGIRESFVAIQGVAARDQVYEHHEKEIEQELSRIGRIVRQLSSLYWEGRSRGIRT